MITENIVLEKDIKKSLKHLAIDKDTHVSLLLVEEANNIIENDKTLLEVNYGDMESFTMKIDQELKTKIKMFCRDKGIKIKDFWNNAARIIIEGE